MPSNNKSACRSPRRFKKATSEQTQESPRNSGASTTSSTGEAIGHSSSTNQSNATGIIRNFQGGVVSPSSNGSTTIRESLGSTETDKQTVTNIGWLPEVRRGQNDESVPTTPQQLRRSSRKPTPYRSKDYEYSQDTGSRDGSRSRSGTFFPSTSRGVRCKAIAQGSPEASQGISSILDSVDKEIILCRKSNFRPKRSSSDSVQPFGGSTFHYCSNPPCSTSCTFLPEVATPPAIEGSTTTTCSQATRIKRTVSPSYSPLRVRSSSTQKKAGAPWWANFTSTNPKPLAVENKLSFHSGRNHSVSYETIPGREGPSEASGQCVYDIDSQQGGSERPDLRVSESISV